MSGSPTFSPNGSMSCGSDGQSSEGGAPVLHAYARSTAQTVESSAASTLNGQCPSASTDSGPDPASGLEPAFLGQFQNVSLAHRENHSSHESVSPALQPLALPASSGSVAQRLETKMNEKVWTPPQQPQSSTESAKSPHPAILGILGSCQDARDRILGIEKAIGKASGVPPIVLTGLHVDIQGLDTTFKSIQNCLDFLQKVIDDKNGDAAKTTALYHENEKLKHEIGELKSQAAHQKEVIQHLQGVASNMHKGQVKHELELKSLREQLESGRSLWLQTQSREEERRSVPQSGDRNVTPALLGRPMSGGPMSGGPMSGGPMSGGPMSGGPMSGSMSGPSTPRYRAGSQGQWQNGTPQQFAGPLVMASQHRRGPVPMPAQMPTPARNQYAQRGGMQFGGGNRPHAHALEGTPSSVGSSGQVRYNFDDGVPPTPNFLAPSPMAQPFMPVSEQRPPMNKATEAVIADIALHFDKVFRMVRGFAETYCRLVPGVNLVPMVQSTAPRLWEFMCEVVYPTHTEAGIAHASHLLQDNEALPFFLTRLLLQYASTSMLGFEGWLGFHNDLDVELRENHARLLSLDVHKTAERHAVAKAQSKAVLNFVSNPDWETTWKTRRALYHGDRLTTIAGPMIYLDDATRSRAQKELVVIAEVIMNLSVRLFQTEANFLYKWSDTCSKFSEHMHRAINSQQSPMRLQMSQWRLKLVVTPYIQICDDSTLTAPKHVVYSQVLVMN